MKKIILLLSLLSLTSCGETDRKIKIYVKCENTHLDRYIYIRQHSTNAMIIHYIDSLKIQFKKEALLSKGFLKAKEGIMYGHFPESLEIIEEYINKLE